MFVECNSIYTYTNGVELKKDIQEPTETNEHSLETLLLDVIGLERRPQSAAPLK